MKLLRAFVFGVGIVAAATLPAQSQTKIALGYTATVDIMPMFVGVEKGIFAKHGLAVTPQLVSLNSLLPPALMADSIQLGMTTATTFLQGVDGGIDLVSVAALIRTRKDDRNFGVVARTGSGVKNAQDLVGKRVGVPGLNAFLHVLFIEWAKRQGVDTKRITVVETPFPQMNEILKSGAVDAVVAAEPFQSRILKAGTGSMIAYFAQEVPEGLPIVVFSATRSWVEKNTQAAKAFRQAMDESMKWVYANPEEAREIVARNLKLPVELVRAVQLPAFGVDVTPASLRSWIEIMKEQNMLTRPIEVEKLILR
jgi:NitT/TauT family transport system substrate-binding protein